MNVLILHGIGGRAGIHWQQWLHDTLAAEGHTVIMPDLSDSDHPARKQWLSEAKEGLGSIDPASLVIVGHSLGVTTALDLIEQLPAPIKGPVTVSGFAVDYGASFNGYFLREKTVNFDRVNKNTPRSFVFFGDDDPYVTQAALQDLADELKVKPAIIAGGGHLNTEAGFTEFPPILEAARSLV
jgi:predicted alpha/beta hydrolase family esterase